ncbi:tyrosine-type recombinase/integrase [Planktomarina temperata]|uniref:Prophage integrase n=1 Tax=Planktomarina temperata RCA23 TaxID=666509 RepID=A0AAN0RID9_9RHOB|nr:putative prophage integrase [Planktomarina temperata RCA23]
MSKLSVRLIETIKPTAKRQRVPDAVVQGLSLVVQPAGKKLFQYRYRFNNKDKSVSLGTVPAMSLKEARDKAVDFRRMLDNDIDPLHTKRQQRAVKVATVADLTISTLLARYDREKLSQLRSRTNALTFLREFRSEFGELEINNFTKQHFTALTGRFAREGKGTKANRVHTHIKTFYNWAIGQGIVETSPCDRVPKPYIEQSKERFLLDNEIKLFWEATGGDLEPWGYLYRFLLLTGQRLNEAAYMTDMEVRQGYHWHLSAQRTKNKLRHDVFLPRQAVEIINRDTRIAGQGDFVFTTTGDGAVRSFDKPNKRLRAKMNELAGRDLEHFTPHDLRRTCETGLAMLGTPQPIIDRITNHVTGRGMSRVYNMYDYRDEKLAAIQKWADHVEGVVS